MSKFNASTYYRLTSDASGSERTMGCGNATVPRDVTVGTFGRFPSENWQFLYQDGVYFIRNYAYNTSYHLGVNNYMLSAPIMLKATTELGQQWNIDSWGDGTYRLSNRLINSGATGITYVGVGESWNNVLMLSRETGSKWTITSNLDIGLVSAAMLSTYTSIETPTNRPTATQTSAATPAATSDSGFFDPEHLRTFDKVGIALGIMVILVVGTILWLFHRRYKKHGHAASRRTPRASAPIRPQHRAAEEVPELPEPPPAYIANSTDPTYSGHGASTHGSVPDYYAPSGNIRRKAADEESIELPPYGRPTTHTRSFL